MRLEDAAGRVAAADVTSPIDVPPFARSAMDGYAVIAADTVAAHAARRRRGCASSIASTPAHRRAVTIAPARARKSPPARRCPTAPTRWSWSKRPRGQDGDAIDDLHARRSPGQHIGRRGADIAAGDRVVAAGDLLTPSRVGALAAIGRADVEVFARPRVAILSTGNEVVEPGGALAPGQIYDVNRFTLGAIVGAHGGDRRAASRRRRTRSTR